jgi:hypothetical protein
VRSLIGGHIRDLVHYGSTDRVSLRNKLHGEIHALSDISTRLWLLRAGFFSFRVRDVHVAVAVDM